MLSVNNKKRNATDSNAVADEIKVKNSRNAKATENFGKLGIQAKRTIGKPNDKYEQEANRIADKVVSSNNKGKPSESSASVLQSKDSIGKEEELVQLKALDSTTTPWVHKKEKEKEETKPLLLKKENGLEPEFQMKPEEDEISPKLIQKQVIEEDLQAKRKSSQIESTSAEMESKLNDSKSGGSPLENDTRTYMEERIGADFRKVKIHTDSKAVQMSKEIGPQAFTTENHVYFNQGKYNPKTREGKHLLAHELTHTIQQLGGKIQKKGTDHKEDKKKEKLSKNQVLNNITDWLLKFKWPIIEKYNVKVVSAYALEMAKSISDYRARYFYLSKKEKQLESSAIISTVKSIYSNLWSGSQHAYLLNYEVIKQLHNKFKFSIYKSYKK
jgi:hypothetical protein